MVEWFCSFFITSVAPDKNPAEPQAGAFLCISALIKRVLNNPAGFGSSPKTDVFVSL